MLTPKTPLPWKPEDARHACLFGIQEACDTNDIPESYAHGGFKSIQDRDYAVYAANLLPELINALRLLSKPCLVPPDMIAKEVLKYAEDYRP